MPTTHFCGLMSGVTVALVMHRSSTVDSWGKLLKLHLSTSHLPNHFQMMTRTCHTSSLRTTPSHWKDGWWSHYPWRIWPEPKESSTTDQGKTYCGECIRDSRTSLPLPLDDSTSGVAVGADLCVIFNWMAERPSFLTMQPFRNPKLASMNLSLSVLCINDLASSFSILLILVRMLFYQVSSIVPDSTPNNLLLILLRLGLWDPFCDDCDDSPFPDAFLTLFVDFFLDFSASPSSSELGGRDGGFTSSSSSSEW